MGGPKGPPTSLLTLDGWPRPPSLRPEILPPPQLYLLYLCLAGERGRGCSRVTAEHGLSSQSRGEATSTARGMSRLHPPEALSSLHPGCPAVQARVRPWRSTVPKAPTLCAVTHMPSLHQTCSPACPEPGMQ